MGPPPAFRIAESRHRLNALSVATAIFAPLAIFCVLVFVTAGGDGERKDETDIFVAPVEPPVPELVEPTEIELDDSTLTSESPDEIEIGFENAEKDLPEIPSPGEVFDLEPDKVVQIASPVTMNAVVGKVRLRGLDNGEGGDFGMRIGEGGRGHYLDGALVGRIIDFKRKRDGSMREDYTDEGYWADVRKVVAADFSEAAMDEYYRPKKEMAFTHLLMRRQPAENAPKAFGVEREMTSRGWAIYYRGEIEPGKSSRYRFVGYFDDQLVVRINRKVVLEANWGGGKKPRPRRITGWTPSDREHLGKWAGFHGIVSPLVPGDWFETKAGEKFFVEIMIGERAGSKVGGLLLIEEAGVQYPLDHVGRPVFPIFASRPLSVREREYIASLKYRIGVDSPPFNAEGFRRAVREIVEKDVPVQVDME